MAKHIGRQTSTLRTGPWARGARLSIYLVVTCLAFVAGRYQVAGFGLMALGLGALFMSWARSTAKETLTVVLLASVLWLGFFQEPITSGNYVYWAQDAFIVLILVAIAFRHDRPSRLALAPILIPLVLIALLTLPGSLATDPPLVYLNGLRRIGIAPLVFVIGQALFTERITKSVPLLVVLTGILQLPASLALVSLRTGSPFSLPGPDLLTGTFGRGGSGYIAVFAPAVLSFVVWRFWRDPKSWPLLAVSTVCFVALGIISDLKYLYLVLPICLAAAFVIWVRQPGGGMRWKTVLPGLAGLAVLLAATGFVVTSSSSRWHGGELSASSFVDPAFYRQFLYMDTGGVISDPYTPARLSRYGALAFSWNYASQDLLTLISGYGLGSTVSEGAFGTANLEELLKLGGLDYSAISVLLFETGVVGAILFLSPILILMILAFRTLHERDVTGTGLETLSGLLFLYGVSMVASLVYNGFALTPRGGGAFWLIGGLWLACRRSRSSERGKT